MNKHRLGLALAAGLLSAANAQAEPFTIFVYETPAEFALRDDGSAGGQAYWAEYARYADVLQASGALRGGAALEGRGRVLKADIAETAGAVGSAGLQLGGYFLIDAQNREAAAALAAQSPSVRRGGAAEIRANYPAPTMTR